VADELNIRKVLIPPHNGIASAYGLLTAGFRREFSSTYLTMLRAIDDPKLGELMRGLREDALARLSGEEIDTSRVHFDFAADMRYLGQGFEVVVPFPDNDRQSVLGLAEAFTAAQLRRYGFTAPEKEIQLVTLRLTASTPPENSALPRVRVGETAGPLRHHPLLEGGVEVEAAFYHRASLPVGATVNGPAVIEDASSTTFIPSGWRGSVDLHTNLILEREK
jgi:N-methylhydantoinase A